MVSISSQLMLEKWLMLMKNLTLTVLNMDIVNNINIYAIDEG